MFDLQLRQKTVGRPQTTSSRAFAMMYAIWRHGSLGTKAIHRLAAPKDSLYGVSKELIKLENRGLIEGFKGWRVGFRWLITPKGYQLLEPYIAEHVGIPSVGIEQSISDITEEMADRWCHFQQSVFLLNLTLMALDPGDSAEGVTLRELYATRVREKYPWLPNLGSARPGSLIHWPNTKRGRTFAIEVLPAVRRFSSRVQDFRTLRRLKVDEIFLIHERVSDADNRSDHFLRSVFQECGIKDNSRWHIVEEQELSEPLQAPVFNVQGKPRGTLATVLGLNPDEARSKAKALRAMAEDVMAKPKVWGRAYQR